MRNNTGRSTQHDRWVEMNEQISGMVPHLYGWFNDEEGFIELRIKLMRDGTHLAVAKGYGSDGGPIVCFGSGYGVVGAIMAVDRTIQGGNWRVDKPWEGSKG